MGNCARRNFRHRGLHATSTPSGERTAWLITECLVLKKQKCTTSLLFHAIVRWVAMMREKDNWNRPLIRPNERGGDKTGEWGREEEGGRKMKKVRRAINHITSFSSSSFLPSLPAIEEGVPERPSSRKNYTVRELDLSSKWPTKSLRTPKTPTFSISRILTYLISAVDK